MIWVTAIAAIVVAIATITLAIFNLFHVKATRQMVREMKEAREMQSIPSITAYFDTPVGTLIHLVVKNIGYGVAKDVHFKIAPQLLTLGDKDIAELLLFKKGVKFLPPNREYRVLVGPGKDFLGENSQRPLEYELAVSYCDTQGKVFEQIIPLDLSIYRGLPLPLKSDVAEEIKKLREAIEKKS